MEVGKEGSVIGGCWKTVWFGKFYEQGRKSLQWSPVVCMLFVRMSAGSSVCEIFTEVSLLSQLPQKPVLSFKCFALFAKGRDTDGETVYSDADEPIITQPG